MKGVLSFQRNYYNHAIGKNDWRYWYALMTPYVLEKRMEYKEMKKYVPVPTGANDRYTAYQEARKRIYAELNRRDAEIQAASLKREKDVVDGLGWYYDDDGNIRDKATGKVLQYANPEDKPNFLGDNKFYILAGIALLLFFLIIKNKKKG
jgi:hypothetical protein